MYCFNSSRIFPSTTFFAEGKKVKGWLGMESVGGVGLDVMLCYVM